MEFSFKRDILPFTIATLGEFAALFFWLRYTQSGQPVLAASLLWGGFLVERISVVLWMRLVFRARADQPNLGGSLLGGTLTMLGVTLSEIAIWVVWYWGVGAAGHVLAGLFLLFAMQAEHAMEMAILRRQPMIKYVLNLRTWVFTIMEVVGAILWLFLTLDGHPGLGALALLVGLSIEHVLQGSQLRPEETEEPPHASQVAA